MNSITAYSAEIDDLNETVSELFSQTEGFAFQKNSMAILFAEEETDFAELYRLLSERWKFPVIGCTAMAMLLGREGYRGIGVSVLLLTADDCEFAAGLTEELDMDNYKKEIARTYDELRGRLGGEVKLIVSYGGTVTDESCVAGDDLVDALNLAAERKVPVYGGAASDGFSFTGCRVFCNGELRQHGQVMALISGNVEPRFVRVNSVAERASFSYEVTKARNNIVYRLGGGTFLEALRREEMEVDKRDVMGDYILSPFLLEIGKDDGDRVEVARTLSLLNQQEGSGAFLGSVPEGSTLSIGIITRPEVQSSVAEAFESIYREIGASGREYHTILCTSCCARFLAMASNTSAEADAYAKSLPEGMSLMGMYGYGEYCPVRGIKTGVEYNMFHNFTFTILAM